MTERGEGRSRGSRTLPGLLATAEHGPMNSPGDRELQAKEYLAKHRIMELLSQLTSFLLFDRPSKEGSFAPHPLHPLPPVKWSPAVVHGLVTPPHSPVKRVNGSRCLLSAAGRVGESSAGGRVGTA